MAVGVLTAACQENSPFATLSAPDETKSLDARCHPPLTSKPETTQVHDGRARHVHASKSCATARI